MASSWVQACNEFKNAVFNRRTTVHFVALEISSPCFDAGHASCLPFILSNRKEMWPDVQSEVDSL